MLAWCVEVAEWSGHGGCNRFYNPATHCCSPGNHLAVATATGCHMFYALTIKPELSFFPAKALLSSHKVSDFSFNNGL